MSSLLFHEEASADVSCFLRRILFLFACLWQRMRTKVSLRYTNIHKQRGGLLMGHNTGLSRVCVASIVVDVTLTC